VVISTAHGLKFAEQKTAYHLGQIEGVASKHANRPLEISADLPTVMDAIKRYAEKVDELGA
jgi:threonine synthase